ncbi:hypothetical protein M3666_12065 [Curtobacterium sp. ODYSSEY 48 V2]|uniref:hypothetical protein n=1 Tax=Curtobacterium sp. ODYSSEY 48 V2 TaxID=2939561 RepID=UPI002041D16E|nr:hypothetical protein [Curtobacterium sp. ODYSSEY 48 V2]MCM3505849.1 hypothetical protein [Curtobacterium sp. ODYSSEY 48 V2]
MKQTFGRLGRTKHKRRQAIVATVATGLMVAGITVAVQPQAAQAATTTQLVTGANRAALADNIAALDFASGSSKAVIVQGTDALTSNGATLASRLGAPVLVASSGTSASSLQTRLKALKVTDVTLVSRASTYFTSSFESELKTAGASVSTRVSGASDFALTVAAAQVGPSPSEVVLADRDDAFATSLATAYAGSRALPLISYQIEVNGDALKTYLTSLPSTVGLTVIGDPAAAPTAYMNEEQIASYHQEDSTDPLRAAVWSVAQSQAAGRNTANITVAPNDSRESISLAALHANRTGGIALPAGATGALTTNSRANDVLGFWRTGAKKVSLVGMNVSSTDMTNVAKPTTTAANGHVAFRATALTRTSAGGFQLTVAAVSGATSYEAVDLSGATLASSSTTTLSFADNIPAVRIAAKKSGTELAAFEFRSNSYGSDDVRASVALGSMTSGKATLVMLGSANVPRLITRLSIDPYSQYAEPTPEKPVAITCAATWTDSNLDSTKQYEYAVSELTNVTSTACSSTLAGAPASAVALNAARLVLPAVTFPTNMAARSATTTAGASPARPEGAAARTVIDSLMMGTSSASARSMSTQSLADSAPDVLVRWNAYIPESLLYFPGFTGDFSKPFFGIHGDGRGSDPNATGRFQQTIRAGFGSDHYVRYDDEKMGESIGYKCTFRATNCTEIARRTAPYSELNGRGELSTPYFNAATLRASATIPIVPGAPAIDTDVEVWLGFGGSRIFGYHDNMPKHEAFFGVVQSEWYKVYSSPYVNYGQLPCLFSTPSTGVASGPLCGVYFNAQI